MLTSPPDRVAVFQRSKILAAYIVHAMAWPPPDLTPTILDGWSDDDRDGFIQKFDQVSHSIRDSLESSGLWADTTPQERAFFKTRLLDRTMQQFLSAAWSMESLACCLWALGLLPGIPPYDAQSSVLDRVPKGDVSELGESRSAAEIVRARSVAELWHWRSRTRQLQDQGHTMPPLPGGHTLDDIVLLAAEKATDAGDIAASCGGDLPAFGKPYRELSPEEVCLVASIAGERRKALNWLSGLALNNQWDQTPTDT